MMTTTEQLERQIEQLIRDHIADVRRRAAAAVERGLATMSRPAARATRVAPRRAAQPRASSEIARVSELLYTAVCSQPGATMATLAPVIGVSVRALERPAQLLKRTGRLRSAGQRQAMRYFPMTPKDAR